MLHLQYEDTDSFTHDSLEGALAVRRVFVELRAVNDTVEDCRVWTERLLGNAGRFCSLRTSLAPIEIALDRSDAAQTTMSFIYHYVAFLKPPLHS